MPLMFIHAPEGLYPEAVRTDLATALTDLGLACENLPNTPFVRSTTWIYFPPYPGGTIYNGGTPAETPLVSLEVNVLEGGLEALGKERLMAGATALLKKYARHEGEVPVYVVIRDVSGLNWGFMGAPASLGGLRGAPEDATPL